MSVTTDFAGNVVQKPFSWSWTTLEGFETCAKKLYHSKVKKDYPEPVNPDSKWGLQVHSAMADRIAKGKRLPDGMQQWEKWADYVLENSDRTQVVTKVEHKLAITSSMQPCEYFSKTVPVWFRTVADVLKIRGEYGRLVDWKTGNFKEGSDQLLLGAATAMAHYPELNYVLCQFIWLKNDLKTEELFTRSDVASLMARVLPRVDALEQAHRTGVWPEKPSGLCKAYCSVTSCQYHGRGNR